MAEPMTRREKWYLGVIIVIMLVGGAMWAHRPQQMPIRNSPVNQAVQPTKPHWTERYQTLIAGLFALVGGVGAVYAGRKAYAGAVDAAKETAKATIRVAEMTQQEARDSREYALSKERAEFERARFHVVRGVRRKVEMMLDRTGALLDYEKRVDRTRKIDNAADITKYKSRINFIDINFIADSQIIYFSDATINAYDNFCVGVELFHNALDTGAISHMDYVVCIDNIYQKIEKISATLEPLAADSHLSPPPPADDRPS